jgi:hypothetical protein
MWVFGCLVGWAKKLARASMGVAMCIVSVCVGGRDVAIASPRLILLCCKYTVAGLAGGVATVDGARIIPAQLYKYMKMKLCGSE